MPELSPERDAGASFDVEAPLRLLLVLQKLWRAFIFGVVLCSAVCTARSDASADQAAGVAAVIDGDTIKIHGRRIRLAGIDAPESGQICLDASGQPWPCGRRAALALADLAVGRTFLCKGRTRDRYGRLVAVCHAGKEEINAWLVLEGWAVAYRRYSTEYVDEESIARANLRGLWAGSFVMPWDWRRRH